MKSGATRLDQAVVAAGLAPTREKAQRLILAGRVRVDGQRRDKPGVAVPEGAVVELDPGDRPFASRGGQKLAGVLGPLAVDPAGLRCLDVGASTGGFTDVLLRGGAVHVTALDVGRGLIDATLRADPRVVVVEEKNARELLPEDVAPPYGLAVIDVSFISLALVLPAVVPLVPPPGRVLALVKPQFEAGRREVARGQGVIRDAGLRRDAVLRVAAVFAGLGCGIIGAAASPVAGPQGNREVFLLAAPGAPGWDRATLVERIEEEVRREPS